MKPGDLVRYSPPRQFSNKRYLGLLLDVQPGKVRIWWYHSGQIMDTTVGLENNWEVISEAR